MHGGDAGGFEESFGNMGVVDSRAGGQLVSREGQRERSGDGGVLEVELGRGIAGAQGIAGGGTPGFEVGFKEEVLHFRG